MPKLIVKYPAKIEALHYYRAVEVGEEFEVAPEVVDVLQPLIERGWLEVSGSAPAVQVEEPVAPVAPPAPEAPAVEEPAVPTEDPAPESSDAPAGKKGRKAKG